jgi:hypothetical protein
MPELSALRMSVDVSMRQDGEYRVKGLRDATFDSPCTPPQRRNIQLRIMYIMLNYVSGAEVTVVLTIHRHLIGTPSRSPL